MTEEIYDLAVIGGGINGCAVARDAAGRGCSVALFEQGDLASGTSWASTKLIHGGLRYLEQGDFRLVREALREREVLWRQAPHLVRPARFILPTRAGRGRPAALLRLGLFLYDHLAGRSLLPGGRRLDLTRDPAAAALRPEVSGAFAYADCRGDDARLTVALAQDAAAQGASIRVGARVTAARRRFGAWELSVRQRETGEETLIRARMLVNAAGPWVERVAVDREGANGGRGGKGAAAPPRRRVRLVQGSHIVVPKLFAGDDCFTLQNDDGRVTFVLPYEDDFTLIGATDVDFTGDPARVEAGDDEIAYLCAAVNRWLARPVAPADVVWRFAGVRALFDDGSAAAQEVGRDHVLALEAPTDGAPLLTIYGGKLTAHRRVAESVLEKLGPYLPAAAAARGAWTAAAPLPGGDFPVDGLPEVVGALLRRYAFLPEALARRLARTYGTRGALIIGDARRLYDLGRDFGGGLTEAEVDYLRRAEWARAASDILWRRSKLGLRLSAAQSAALADYLGAA